MKSPSALWPQCGAAAPHATALRTTNPGQNRLGWRSAAFLLLLLWTPLACRGFAYQRSEAVEAKAAKAGVRRFTVETGGYNGLSGLTLDNQGHFWAIPEQGRVLLRLRLEGAQASVDGPPIPVEGVPDGMDTESIAWLSDNKFAVGTESEDANRAQDFIYLLSVQGNRAQITDQVAFPYGLWGITARINQGIEGLCSAGGHLVAAGEPVGVQPNGRRFAPVGRYDSHRSAWTPFSVLLTTPTGKISALACRQNPLEPHMTLLAIERHFGVSRLLRFVLPTAGSVEQPIEPEVLVDFARVVEGLPNYEGVSWSQQGDIFVLADNFSGVQTGPTEGLIIPRAWIQAGASR